MIKNYSAELESVYMPYAILGNENQIIGFEKEMPQNAKQAALEHIAMSKKFDDPSNYSYWNDLALKLL